eukprot:COSAG02_NODE_839_length_16629_cov_15.583908_3_plen_466_part_00
MAPPLTKAQRDLLTEVQYKRRVLAGRDTLYAAVRQHVARTGSDVQPPSKRQIGEWLGHTPAYTRQQSTGAALPEHKPVAVIRRSEPLQYLMADCFQLPQRATGVKVMYAGKKAKRGKKSETAVVTKYGLLVVDVFSRMVWVRVLQTPQGAGVNGAYEGLKRNEDVIGVASALDDVFEEIDQDLDGGLRQRGLQCGSDNGGEFTNADVARIMKKWSVRHTLGMKGRPMSQSMAEAHIGVMKRRFALWVRARLAARRESDEDLSGAIKASWPDVIDDIVAGMNDSWSSAHPRPLTPLQVHYGDDALLKKVKAKHAKEAGKRAKHYEADNDDRYEIGDLVRRRVAKSDKLDAAYSQSVYKVVGKRHYTKVRRPTGYRIQLLTASTPEPTLFRAAQLIRAYPAEEQVRHTQAELRVDEDAEYFPWRVLETRQREGRTEARVQWAGYPIAQSTWEDAAEPAIAALLEGVE